MSTVDKDPSWFTFNCSHCKTQTAEEVFICCSKIEGRLLIMFSIFGFGILGLTILIQYYLNYRRLNDFSIVEKKTKSTSSKPTTKGSGRMTEGRSRSYFQIPKSLG